MTATQSTAAAHGGQQRSGSPTTSARPRGHAGRVTVPPTRAAASSANPFWSRVDGTGDCWVWIGALDRYGYGKFYDRATGRHAIAHRYAYEALVGPIPDGLQLDHLCRNRACCNPSHLEPVTSRENSLRSPLRGGKTHCIRGHEFIAANTRVRIRNGFPQRECKACAALLKARNSTN